MALLIDINIHANLNIPGPDIILHQFSLAPFSLVVKADDCLPIQIECYNFLIENDFHIALL